MDSPMLQLVDMVERLLHQDITSISCSGGHFKGQSGTPEDSNHSKARACG